MDTGLVVIQGSKDICSTAYLIMHSIIVLAEWLIDVLNPHRTILYVSYSTSHVDISRQRFINAIIRQLL